jgi:purine-nucleoside phosphorylase
VRAEAQQATKYIRERYKTRPKIGIILGSGLGKLAKAIMVDKSIDYSNIPHFPTATVEFHKGRLILGTLRRKPVVVMQGRFHYYEGYSAKQIAFPVLVMKMLGIRTIILSNACGGLNPDFSAGELMLIKDHINLIPDSPLRGANDRKLGPRFPDLYDCYSKKLIGLAERSARDLRIPIHKGVYAAVPGPNLETNAEYRFLRSIGADAVGMSTVPEVLMARYLKISVLGISVITDMGITDSVKPVNIIKILRAAAKADPLLTKIISNVVARL